ncbi:MAG: hypothetical protein CFE45_19920, partial [Burkholderiales bacterium PBB5]
MRAATARVRGMSIVELMVGITIGLFILAGATTVATSQLGNNRRLLLETQVQQDMRLTIDLIARDLRRAGYWGHADYTVWPEDVDPNVGNRPLTVALGNPYAGLLPDSVEGGTTVQYKRSTDEDGGFAVVDENNVVDTGDVGGFRYNASDKSIEAKLSPTSWQKLTDPTVLLVTRFAITIVAEPADVPCGAGACPVLAPDGCPLKLVTHHATIEIEGEA